MTNLPVGSINPLLNTSNTLNTDSPQQQQQQQQQLKLGARCLKISPGGEHLATGDRNGNIRVYDLSTLESICLIEAHDGEVLYLQYSSLDSVGGGGSSGRLLLASSSRDRLIHIFDATAPRSSYELLQTLDDHSAAITAVRFCLSPAPDSQLYVISCGADKSIMFRTNTNAAQAADSDSTNNNNNEDTPAIGSDTPIEFTRTSYVAEKQTFYDLCVDASRTSVHTISQDRMVRTYSLKDGKKLRQFRGSLNEDGYLLRMDTDRASTMLATSCSDKCVFWYDPFCDFSENVSFIGSV